MTRRHRKLEQKSPAKPAISGALDDNDLKQVSGGKESISLTYGSVVFVYTEQKSDGGPAPKK